MGGPDSLVRIGGLPADTTSFIGRKANVAEVRRLVSAARLVTLTGTAGVGKTRPALTLFAERARAAEPSFALTAENEAKVVRVCQLLDGLPLAIELVAVRLRALPLDHLLSRLADRYWTLAVGRRGRVPRHQTLE